MRSSVSVILSSPVAEISMSYPDYTAHPNHHHSLILLVRPVGSQIKSRSFNKLFERISKVTHVKVNDSNGSQRSVWVAYKKDYPIENNEWGDFQTHRRVLGIITIGEAGCQSDMNTVCNEHDQLKSKYSSTVYDSRCIILGLNPDGSVYSPNHVPSPTPEPSDGINDRDSGVYETSLKPEVISESPDEKKSTKAGSDSGSESTTEFDEIPSNSDPESREESLPNMTNGTPTLQPPISFKTRILFYPTGDHAVNIESQIQEFVGYLFWVLEYKRMDKAKEKLDKPHILCAPFEKKDFVGLDLDSRTNKKRCMGRIKKHLGDLSLQAGLIAESLSLYNQAADVLKSCNDWLWLAACYEGLCAASALTLYPEMYQRRAFQRHSSYGMGRSSKEGPPISDSRVKNIGTSSLPPGLSQATAKQISKFCLCPEDLLERYKDAIVHYSKYRNAGVIETEASLKAVHVLIEQKQYLSAAEFLNNVVFINLQLRDEEKIVRFNSLATMYQQIGFHRKAAFFRRVAAMRCVAPQNPNPDWSQCYKLLLHTLTGYKLTLDLAQFTKDNRPGWPALQKQILHELKGTSQRMGENSLCSRHHAFLLSSMLPYMTDAEKQENFAMLEAICPKYPSGTNQMVVPESGIILPPVSFMNIPVCRAVKVLELAEAHQVDFESTDPIEQSPFIFSPFLSMSNEVKVPGKIDHLWVVGDVCNVTIFFQNSLPFPIKLTDVKILTEGVEFESWSSTVTLNKGVELQAVLLHGTPRGSGELRIVGYSFVLSGVHSQCKFKSMPHLNVPYYFLDVVDAMPFVTVSCNVKNPIDDQCKQDFSVNLSIYAGETAECNVIINNSSTEPVEKVDLCLESAFSPDIQSQIFQYSLQNLEAQLPITPGGKASLTLYLYASADFLLPGYKPTPDDASSVVSEQSSLFSRNSNVMSSFLKKRKQITGQSNSIVSLQSSSSYSGPESIGSGSSLQNTGPTSKIIEGSLRLSYTGGKAKDSSYFRNATVTVHAKVLPSLLVTRWDAIPSEISHQCYIVLDLCNVSSHEMDLQYTMGRNILIQPGESCRVPVPVDRCPISKLERVNGEVPLSTCEMLARYIASSIDLQWELSPTETPGKALLDSLPFPVQTHHLITLPPIHWVVEINGEVSSGGADNSGRVGELQHLKVGWKNTSGKTLPPVTLEVCVFQDYQNGSTNLILDNKLATVGATRVDIGELDPDLTYLHECDLIFYTPGIYKIELICAVRNIGHVYGVPWCNKDIVHDDKTWKLAPPLEINIEM